MYIFRSAPVSVVETDQALTLALPICAELGNAIRRLASGGAPDRRREGVVEPFLQARVKERTVLQFTASVSQLNRHEREYTAVLFDNPD